MIKKYYGSNSFDPNQDFDKQCTSILRIQKCYLDDRSYLNKSVKKVAVYNNLANHLLK